jgi:hypothetical protein
LKGYAVDTGFRILGNGNRELALLICSAELIEGGLNGGWLEDVTNSDTGAVRRVSCGEHGGTHEVVDFSEAVRMGIVVAGADQVSLVGIDTNTLLSHFIEPSVRQRSPRSVSSRS